MPENWLLGRFSTWNNNRKSRISSTKITQRNRFPGVGNFTLVISLEWECDFPQFKYSPDKIQFSGVFKLFVFFWLVIKWEITSCGCTFKRTWNSYVNRLFFFAVGGLDENNKTMLLNRVLHWPLYKTCQIQRIVLKWHKWLSY